MFKPLKFESQSMVDYIGHKGKGKAKDKFNKGSKPRVGTRRPGAVSCVQGPPSAKCSIASVCCHLVGATALGKG